MISFLQLTQVITGVLLILLVLMHSPKGAGMAAIGDAAQLFSSQSSAEAGLNKLTSIVSVIFIASSLILGIGIIR